MIRLEDISKTYNKNDHEVRVLKSINCSINNGDMIAIMGRSGSGKTTLIHILSGLLQQSDGRYFFDSEDVSNYSIRQRDAFRQRHIGIVVQDYALFNSMTAYENIILPLKYRGIDKQNIKKQIEDISESLNIENCLEKKVYQLSGGECQRVSIARALIKKPSLILADEPTGSLDSKTEQDVMSIFKQLKSTGNTIIIATHSSFVSEFCDYTLQIDDGELSRL